MMSNEITQIREEVHSMRESFAYEAQEMRKDFAEVSRKIGDLTEVMIRKEERDVYVNERLAKTEERLDAISEKIDKKAADLDARTKNLELVHAAHKSWAFLKNGSIMLIVAFLITGILYTTFGNPKQQSKPEITQNK